MQNGGFWPLLIQKLNNNEGLKYNISMVFFKKLRFDTFKWRELLNLDTTHKKAQEHYRGCILQIPSWNFNLIKAKDGESQNFQNMKTGDKPTTFSWSAAILFVHRYTAGSTSSGDKANKL
jgi:hypothetical protein